MLTILETYTAIKALDTEKDIIEGACRKVLGLDKEAPLTEELIAAEIIRTYMNIPPSKLLVSSALVVGILAGLTAKPGHEGNCLNAIMELIADKFAQSSATRLNSLVKENPAAAAEQLMEMLSSISKTLKPK